MAKCCKNSGPSSCITLICVAIAFTFNPCLALTGCQVYFYFLHLILTKNCEVGLIISLIDDSEGNKIIMKNF